MAIGGRYTSHPSRGGKGRAMVIHIDPLPAVERTPAARVRARRYGPKKLANARRKDWRSL
jgi:hypothetical protein